MTVAPKKSRTLRASTLVLAAGLALPLLAQAAEDPAVAQLTQRLMAIQANPDASQLAAFERLQAQQAVADLAKAKRRDLDQARYLAERRVEIAETSVRAALAQREVDQLERTRSELLIEASRRDAQRARQETERLRVQAQIQAEETERLRQAAEQEALARQDAETALTSVAGKQTARLSAAQQNALKLAREEAELVSGNKLPGSKVDSRGEVFTFNGDAFAAGKGTLSGGAKGQAMALAEYLNIGKKGRVRIEAYDAAAGVGDQRAQALRDALVAAGVSASRLQVAGKKAAATKARSAEVIIAP
jgi:outer membrane protein OmpA-like peptidoglycan-associated protein